MPVRIRIIKRKRPAENNIDGYMDWLCSTFGFCEPIDKDKTASAIFKNLLQNTKEGEGLRSDDIAARVGKSRGAVVNHLNKLMAAGLVTRRGSTYELREQTLQNTLLEMRKDMDRMFEDMEQIAREIDKQMSRKTRND